MANSEISLEDHRSTAAAGAVGVATGLLASSSLVVAGLTAVGANRGQIASAIAVMLLMYGALTLTLSVRYRMPITIVWSTPGAALLVSAQALNINFNDAIGAFLVAAALITATGFIDQLARLVHAIPAPIASAMLAGVITPFAMSAFREIPAYPVILLPAIGVWIVLIRFAPTWASAAAVTTALVAIVATGTAEVEFALPHFEIVTPSFNAGAMISIGIPLYLVTMASQNLPGAAVMRSFGFEVPFKTAMKATGLASIVGGFFGGFCLNLAAITAAISANEHAHPDSAKRWLAGMWSGIGYMGAALGTVTVVALTTSTETALLLGIAGIALFGTVTSALSQCVAEPTLRLPAVVTFLIGASGMTVVGVAAAFWALATGVVVARFWNSQPQ